MLTRLKVTGFKNLVDVDVRFGPFTCIAGPNGVGKSNLFDAIRFLSALADLPLIDAALSVRDGAGRTADVQSLFHRMGEKHAPEMSFEAEMIVPAVGADDLGQQAKATVTFLRYCLTLAYRRDDDQSSLGSLEILKEELVHITQGEAHKHLLFPHKATTWRKSAVRGRRAGSEFISTEGKAGNRIIKLHQDGGGGRPLSRQAADLPRTVLSVTNAAESPTALLTRREMQSWRLLQLEPSALRKPDEFSAPGKLGADGSHLSATLYRLARQDKTENGRSEGDSLRSPIYARIANRLSGLIDDVRELSIDRDERRELLTLYVTGKDKTSHAARSLSDGTLRFLALAVLAEDPEAQGVLCLEEPENGIHPERIPVMLRLLQDIAADVGEPIGPDNPLRQIVVNTHSPAVVQQVPDDSLLVAELKETVENGVPFAGVCFSYLPETWREDKSSAPSEKRLCPKGRLLAYLNPVIREDTGADNVERGGGKRHASRPRRVIDREDMGQLLLPLPF